MLRNERKNDAQNCNRASAPPFVLISPQTFNSIFIFNHKGTKFCHSSPNEQTNRYPLISTLLNLKQYRKYYISVKKNPSHKIQISLHLHRLSPSTSASASHRGVRDRLTAKHSSKEEMKEEKKRKKANLCNYFYPFHFYYNRLLYVHERPITICKKY